MENFKDLQGFFRESDYFDDDIKNSIILDIEKVIKDENLKKDLKINQQHEKVVYLFSENLIDLKVLKV